MARNDQFEKAIKFISNSITNYTEPESLERWCHLAKTEVGYDKSGHSFGQVLKKIEELKGCSLMEKARLAFIFSRRVSPGLLKILKDAKCVVELNDSRKMTYFRSPDGDCVLQSDQDPNVTTRKFKGEPIQTITKPIGFIRDDDCEKAIKFISNDIKNYMEPENLLRWCELVKTEVGYDKSAEAFSQVLKDEQCLVELNDKGKITYFRSEDRDMVFQSEHKKRNFKGNPCTEKKNTANIQVKIPNNVQTQSPPASPRSLPDPSEMDDMEIANGGKETAPGEEKQEKKAPERKKEKNGDTLTKQKSILKTEENVDVTTESIQQQAPINGPIDYDDMDIGEYPEFMIPNYDESPNHHNKKHQNLSQENDSEESEPEDEVPTNVSDSQNSEHSRIQNELDEQELEDVTVLKQERSFDRKPEKRSENLVPSENAKRVKTEEWHEDFFTSPDAPEDAKINVLLLANNIGIIALYCSLEGVQKKASRAIEKIKMEKKEMTLNVADFNSFIDSMLKSIKRSRNRYACQTGKCLSLKTIYRHIKLSLILPFGPEIAGEALKIVDKEIEELGESHDEVPLETIRRNLEYLLNSSTGFWI
ncbi:unnamed protein product [Caenorhabditis nigoni]